MVLLQEYRIGILHHITMARFTASIKSFNYTIDRYFHYQHTFLIPGFTSLNIAFSCHTKLLQIRILPGRDHNYYAIETTRRLNDVEVVSYFLTISHTMHILKPTRIFSKQV